MASGGFNRDSHPAPFFFLLGGVPFIVIGQYMIWGRFLYTVWKKKRTHYAVTDRRVIVVQNGWQRKMAVAYLDRLPAVTKESGADGIGVLRFSAAPVSPSRRRDWGV